jgi:tetratricopeptide (TPR) repeat protein
LVRIRVLVLTLAFAAFSGTGSPAWAAEDDANRAAARALGKQAVASYKRGDFDAALDKFERAHALVGFTTTGLWTARSLEKVGRLVEASELYLRVARMTVADDAPEQHRQALDEARREREALLPRIPSLTIRVRAPSVAALTVTLDDRPLPDALLGVERPTDPGKHTVVAAAGAQKRSATVALKEGEHEVVELALEAGAPGAAIGEPDSAATGGGGALRVLGWVALGLGGAGVAVGGIGAGLAANKKGELDDGCLDNQCPPPLHDDIDDYQTLRVLSSTVFIAGGALAATGIVLLLAAPSDAAASERSAFGVMPYASPTGGGMVGWF